MQAIRGISVTTLARAKGLDPVWLRAEFGLEDARYAGQRAVRIPYRDTEAHELHAKVRLSDGSMRYAPSGSTPTVYGLERLAGATVTAPVILVEGESDVWAAAAHGVNAIGIPGARAWRTAFALELAPYHRIALWEEPGDAAKRLVVDVARDLPNAWRVAGDSDAKDLCELHQQHGDGFRRALAAKLARAVRLGARAEALARLQAAPAPRPLAPRSAARHQAMHPEFSDALERARDRSIVEVMKAAGVRFRDNSTSSAWCPFHEDTRPSLSVSDRPGHRLWMCHGCQASGDVIAFVERVYGVDFVGAVRQLAGPGGAGSVLHAAAPETSARVWMPRGRVLHAAPERAS